jgi:hypothetical protein
MPELISAEALAKQLGVTGQAVRKAHAAGRLTSFDGKFDPAVARIQWEANRKRRRADAPTRPAEGAGEQTASASSPRGDGSEYWASKTRRETAEASIAELKEAEMRGDLVRRAVVEREFASRLVALRESLEVLADRLSAQVAAEADAGRCRQLLRDEHRLALAAFVERIDLEVAREEA